MKKPVLLFIITLIIPITNAQTITYKTNHYESFTKSKQTNDIELSRIWDDSIEWVFTDDYVDKQQVPIIPLLEKLNFKIIKKYTTSDGLIIFANFPIPKFLRISQDKIYEYYYDTPNSKNSINNKRPFVEWDGNKEKITGYNIYYFNENIENKLKIFYK